MRTLVRSLAMLLLLTSTSLAQITVRNLTVTEVSEKSEKIGSFVVVPKDFSAKPFNIANARWKTEVPKSNLKVKLTDVNRKSVPFIDLDDEGIVVTQVGHFWLSVSGTYVDFDTKTYATIDEEVDFFVDALNPSPTPDPDPTPDPPPAPGKIDNLSVLMVYESGLLPSYTQAQRDIIQSSTLRTWMNDNVPKDAQSLANWRVLDKDTKFPPNSDLVYKKWLVTPPNKLPYLIIGNKDTIVYQGELPTNPEDIKALITRYKK